MRPAAVQQEGEATTLAYAGDVTALCVVPSSSGGACDDILVLVGIGAQLHAYALATGELLLQQCVLPYSCRIHGITAAEWGPAAADQQQPQAQRQLLLAVHGDRHAVLLGLNPAARRLAPACQLPRFYDWTVASQLHVGAAGAGSAVDGLAGGGSRPAILAVGLSDNSVEVFRLSLPANLCSSSTGGASSGGGGGECMAGAAAGTAQRVLRVEGAERCLLFSMALHPLPQVRQCGRSLLEAGTGRIGGLAEEGAGLGMPCLLRC